MLRRWLLQVKDLKFPVLQEIVRVMETADNQAERMEKLTVNVEMKRDKDRDKHMRPRFSKTQRQSPRDECSIKCYRCGCAGHMSCECTVTKNKKCNNCGDEGFCKDV